MHRRGLYMKWVRDKILAKKRYRGMPVNANVYFKAHNNIGFMFLVPTPTCNSHFT